MKKLVLLSFLVLAIFSVKAQDMVFAKGDKAVNLGIGLNYSRIPVYISGEYCIMDDILEKGSIGVGAYAGMSYYYYHYYSTSLYFMAGARGAFHYQLMDKLDTYAGLSLGFDSWYTSFIRFGSFVGGRYYLTPKIGVFGEFAYGGVGYFTAGISFKF
jgi:hypothetical protein